MSALAGPPRSPSAAAARGGGPGMGPRGGAMLGVPVEKSLDFWPSARRLLRRLRPERARLSAVVALAVASVTLTVIGPRLLGRATDVIVGREGTAALSRVLALALACYLAASLLALVQGRLLATVMRSTAVRLRSDVEDKLHRLPLRHVDAQPRGELLSRVTNDIDNVTQSLQQTLGQLVTSLLTLVGVIAAMFTVSPLLAGVTLLVVPASLLLTRAIARRSQPRFVAQWASTGALTGLVEEVFTGHELVRVLGRQDEVAATFAAENARLYAASAGAQSASGALLPAMTFLGNASYVVVAVVGGLRVAAGAITLGDVQAFVQYSRQFSQPLAQVASMANLMQSGVASAERVFALLDAPEESADPPPAQAAPTDATSEAATTTAGARRRGRVAFEDVSFRYTPDTPLIEHLSLVAEPGQTVAIVGPTGAGKTTLVNLILRFYELDSGRITLDGQDIAAMGRAQVRTGVGMVLQDAWLFGGTIAENIAYGRPDATAEQVLAAARATYVDRFVRHLPDGYDTVLDAEGGGLSAGERQLVTIARAFLSDPSLLILDEATSSVDTRTEVLVQQAMAALRSDRTSFVIAHRLSTITGADLILVMEAGSIVEQGTHAQLLAAGGAYARLQAAQTAAAPTDEVPALPAPRAGARPRR